MSFYSMLFGKNQNTPVILALIGLRENDVQRFRDCGLEEDGTIRVYARTGGGNRDDYPNEALTRNPYYLRDEDDDFDSTYATYYFRAPDEIKGDIDGLRDPARYGLSANLIGWIQKTLNREPTESDKRAAAYERQCAVVKQLQASGDVSEAFNGHTVVPLSDRGTEGVLREMEAANGEFLAYWTFAPFAIRVIQNAERWPNTDARKPESERERVRVLVAINWKAIDDIAWDHYVHRFGAKYPKAMATVGKNVAGIRR